MIVVVGESASGKTTLVKEYVKKHPEYRRIVTYTTRPPREGEQDGVDYHFLSEAAFDEFSKRDFFVEENMYRNWRYGTAREDCELDKAIVVLTPAGFRALRTYNMFSDNSPIIVYLYVDRRSRLISMLNRGDDIEEAYRRSLSDVGQFDGVEKEVEICLVNERFQLTPEQEVEALDKAIEEHNEKIAKTIDDLHDHITEAVKKVQTEYGDE